ncbi:YggN family protein [Vibrio sp.]|nr:YggN family protein [Vibrio sp.]
MKLKGSWVNFITLAMSIVALPAVSAQCEIAIHNDLRLNEKQIEIKNDMDKTAMIRDSELFINETSISLSEQQQRLVASYQSAINQYLPQAKTVAHDGIELANNILDDIEVAIDQEGVFDEVKSEVASAFNEVKQSYYKDGFLEIPSGHFTDLRQAWSDDFTEARAFLNSELSEDAFNALSESMKKAQGEINLTQLYIQLSELKAIVESHFDRYLQKQEQKSEKLCESYGDLIEQEEQLHNEVPELKNYPLFTI